MFKEKDSSSREQNKMDRMDLKMCSVLERAQLFKSLEKCKIPMGTLLMKEESTLSRITCGTSMTQILSCMEQGTLI